MIRAILSFAAIERDPGAKSRVVFGKVSAFAFTSSMHMLDDMMNRFQFAASLVSIAASSLPALAQSDPFRAQVIVHFDRTQIAAARLSGQADPFTQRSLKANDPARIASVSKLVVALGVMRMVEAGTLNLDRDVSNYLGWPLRNPAFPNKVITLRLLLSHQSSLTDGAEYIIPLGQTLRARVALDKAWDKDHAPGTYFRYTNLNFPVVASIMEKASGERFDLLMMRLVFRPLNLDACFNWSGCSVEKTASAVVLTDGAGSVRRDRLDGKAPDCLVYAAIDGGCDISRYALGENGALFSPQGGMRISAPDLARIGQMIARRGRGFLKRSSIETITRPAWRFNGTNGDSEGGFFCAYGLAVQTLANSATGCKDDPFGDGKKRIGHAGEAYGLRSGLWFDPKSGKGVAFFVTAVADNAPMGQSAFTAVEEASLRSSPRQPHK